MAAYARIFNAYCKYLAEFAISFCIPYPVQDLLNFLTYSFERGVSYATLCTYLSALSFQVKIRGLHDTTKDFIVKQLMKGIKNVSFQVAVKRLPLFPQHIELLIANLANLNLPSYTVMLLKAMMCLAFALALRLGEMTRSKHNLMFESISFGPSFLVVKFNSFKHSSGDHAMVHVIKKSSSPVCPVDVMKDYIALRGVAHGPLFLLNQNAVTKNFFSKSLQRLLALANLEGRFTPHSFRIGAATWWHCQGFSNSQIRRKGRWASEAYKHYIRGAVMH